MKLDKRVSHINASPEFLKNENNIKLINKMVKLALKKVSETLYPTPKELIQKQITKMIKDKQKAIDNWEEDKFAKINKELKTYLNVRDLI